MKKFWIKMSSLVLALLLIGGYNTVLAMRKQQDEIARLTAELEGSKQTVEAFKKQQQTDNEKAVDVSQESTEEADGLWKDGVYEGEGQGFGGEIVTEVTVKDCQIDQIEIKQADKEDSAYLGMAKDIIADILEAQSTDVDTVSGATFSSTGIREAVKQALEKAE